ncbi:MAG: hypothetical protein Q8O24_09490 [Gallionellaceae bacterium]|nr:hypothetical protein [Gallionellaceae bacterium]
MTELFRVVEVQCADSTRSHSFTLSCGDKRVLELTSSVEKEAMIDLVTGVEVAKLGRVQIVQGDRRLNKNNELTKGGERRHQNREIPVIWQALHKARQGRVAWVSANGGLISNLKVWENVTLPLWHHFRHDEPEAEQRVKHWLALLGMEQNAFADFMAAPPASIELWQRKLAGLLRALVQMPQLLVIDAKVFEGVDALLTEQWVTALDVYAGKNGAVLAITDRPTSLPWQKIE